MDTRHRTILFSNAVAAALVGLDPAQLVGEPVLQFASARKTSASGPMGPRCWRRAPSAKPSCSGVTVRWCRWSSGWWHARRICMTRHCLSP